MFICGACPCCLRTMDPCCPRFRISALSVSLCSCFILRRLLALSPVITTCFCLSSSASSVFCCLVSICGCSWCAFPAHLHLQPPVPLSSPLPLSTVTFPCHLPSPPSLSALAHSSFFSGASSHLRLQPPVPLSSPLPLSTVTFPCHPPIATIPLHSRSLLLLFRCELICGSCSCCL